MERSSLSTGELLLLVVGGVAVLVGVVVWVGAACAAALSGIVLNASMSDALAALPALPRNLTSPGAAWSGESGMAAVNPVVYWLCTVIAVGIAVGVIAVVVRLWDRKRVGTTKRDRLGVDTRPWMARPSDLKPLVVDGPTKGRFILGRVGRRLVASEYLAGCDDDRLLDHPHLGDMGAIAFVGPSRCGKTTAVVSGILEWQGPAILSSVKDDLLRVTAGHRSKLGDIEVFDPTRSTGSDSAAWSPLRQANTTRGAQRAARALVEAAPRSNNVEGGVDFWMSQAEVLLAGLMFTARNTGSHMGVVAEWVLTQDRPGKKGDGEVKAALDRIMDLGHGNEPEEAEEAFRSLKSLWDDDERTRSSVYATARTVVWPWAEPGVAESSQGDSIDLKWLIETPVDKPDDQPTGVVTPGGAAQDSEKERPKKPNTLYLCAPIEDQSRLSPAFGGFLNDLIRQVYLRVAETGKPLDPPLLIAIDEAGNTPLKSLPEYASTLAGLGVLLVTVWQSLAQIESTYGRQTGTILSNHLSKLFYAGLSDRDSLGYVSSVLGEEEIETLSFTDDLHGGRGSRQLSTSRNPLAPPHVVRQQTRGDALLIHGTLPPAHLRTRPYYREPELRERASLPVPKPKRQQPPSKVTEVIVNGTPTTESVPAGSTP